MQNIKLIKKIDLHRHIEGAINPASLLTIYRKNFFKDKKTLKDFEKMLILEKGVGSLDKFIKKLGTPYLKEYVKTPDDLCFIFEKTIEDAHKDNINYLELRFTLSNFMKLDKTPDDLIKKISERMAATSSKLGMKSGLILGIKRDDEISLSTEIIKIASRLYKDKNIVGIDLAGNEHFFPNELFIELGKKIKKENIPFVVHAGEVTNAQSVKTAVEKLGANRIGHGTKAAESLEVLELLAKKKIILEICPTSNIQTGAYETYEDIPIRKILNYKVPVLICTDDPVTSGITLSREIETLIKKSIITLDEYKLMLKNAHNFYFS